MTIQTYVFNTLPPEYKEQTEKISAESYTPGTKPTPEHLDTYCSTPFAWVIAVENSVVVGRIKLFKREIKAKGQATLLGGIGGVYTKIAYRNRGVAKAMMKEAMKKLQSENCDIAYLCTEINNPKLVQLYSHFGFVLLNKPYVFQGKSGKLYEEKDGMIAPLCSDEIFGAVVTNEEKLNLGVGNW